jgi:hypothetical protein
VDDVNHTHGFQPTYMYKVVGQQIILIAMYIIIIAERDKDYLVYCPLSAIFE